MRLQKFSVGLAAAALTMSLASAWAQDERGRPQQSEPSRPSNGDNVGSAVPRGGGDSGSTASTAGSTSSSSGGGASSNGNSTSWMGNGSSGYSAPRAPVHPSDRYDRAEAAGQRHNPGSSSSGRAVPRGESGGKASGSTGSTSASAGSESQPSQGRSRAVPENSRPRDGRTATGTAVPRTYPPSTGGGGYSYYPSYVYDPYYSFYYSPYYSRYGYWNPYGYGYGLGYFSYDPFLFGGLGYPGYYGAGGGYGGGYPESSGGGGYVQTYRGAGSLRLKVKPANAQVFIDGYYVGVIDSFDGVFQRLNVEAGPHHVELRAEGFETTAFDVVVTPGETVTYKGEMKRR